MKLFQRAVIFITILLAVYTILIFILFTNISSFLDFVNVIAIMAVLACLVAILYSSLYLIPLEKAVKIIKNIASGNYARPKKSRQRLFRPVFQDLDSIIEKLELYEQKLTKRKEGFYAVIDSIQEAIWIQDRKGLIRTANESFEKLVQQQNLKNLYFWNVIRSKELYDFVDSIHKQPASSRKEISCAEHYYMCSASILSVTGEILFILYDITEIKKLEILKKDLILNVSHELRTPLTSIKGYLETLEAESDKKMLPYLEIIKRNTDRLINIIRDLLALSELEHSDKLHIETIEIKSFLENLEKVFTQRIKDKKLSLNISVPERLQYLKADRFNLEQVFINLLDNALKHTEHGGIDIIIGKQGQNISIEIRDTGCGIAEQHLPRIFERFYVVDKSRSRRSGSTGLGLSIVKHIIQLHQGTIQVKSELGKGTKFIITLPLDPDAVDTE